jgi:hypothetical protein
VLIGYFILVPFLEIIGYAKGQKQRENTFKKWMEFCSHARIAAIMVILGISDKASQYAVYGVYLALPIYDVVMLKFYIFAYRPIERIMFVLN